MKAKHLAAREAGLTEELCEYVRQVETARNVRVEQGV